MPNWTSDSTDAAINVKDKINTCKSQVVSLSLSLEICFVHCGFVHVGPKKISPTFVWIPLDIGVMRLCLLPYCFSYMFLHAR